MAVLFILLGLAVLVAVVRLLAGPHPLGARVTATGPAREKRDAQTR